MAFSVEQGAIVSHANFTMAERAFERAQVGWLVKIATGILVVPVVRTSKLKITAFLQLSTLTELPSAANRGSSRLRTILASLALPLARDCPLGRPPQLCDLSAALRALGSDSGFIRLWPPLQGGGPNFVGPTKPDISSARLLAGPKVSPRGLRRTKVAQSLNLTVQDPSERSWIRAALITWPMIGTKCKICSIGQSGWKSFLKHN